MPAPFRAPVGLEEIRDVFGYPEFVDLEKPKGAVRVTDGWERENIIIVRLPLVGRQQVHRLMAPLFTEVLQQVFQQKLSDKIKSCGGVYNPRHKMGNPKKPLSTHGLGIAIDLNVAENMPGKPGMMSIELVDVFESYGFEWGGRWPYPDPMHFQYCHGY